MKIAICGDIHFCKNYSIINQRGADFSKRLENCIKSINWFEGIAKQNNCDLEVFLGDVFDSASLDDETITAINYICWNDIPKAAVVGNHESSSADLIYNSLNVLTKLANFSIYAQPTVVYPTINNKATDLQLCYLPYLLERDRKPLAECLTNNETGAKRIIFSHNDINGIQLGPIISKTGFTIEEIETNCDLFINGHLHNGQKITDKIINLGILTGKDFGEDANKYAHNVLILDTDTLKYEYIENPYAFNFYKLEILKKADLEKFKKLKNNAVVSIKCVPEFANDVKKIIEEQKTSICAHRMIIAQADTKSVAVLDAADLTKDHLAKFIECCKEKLDNTDILDQELAEICK